jgi:large subunit ribosomal protein L3
MLELFGIANLDFWAQAGILFSTKKSGVFKMIKEILGKKLGMTTYFDADGNAQPVTVVEAGPCTVIQVKTKNKDGYNALQLGFDEKRMKSTTKPLQNHFKKAGATPKRFVFEIKVPDDSKTEFKLGQVIKLEEIFKTGDVVDAVGWTRGRGFAGVMKRWNFTGADGGHGTHEYFRHGGSIGTNTKPGHVLKGRKMPGHYGNEKVAMLNLEILDIKPEENIVLVKGSVPGVKNGYLIVRHAVKHVRKRHRKALHEAAIAAAQSKSKPAAAAPKPAPAAPAEKK